MGKNLSPLSHLSPLDWYKQGITNTVALPIDKMLFIYLLCPHFEHQNNVCQSKQFKHLPQRNQFIGWSEPAATNAPVENEAVQAVLGMNQKPILFPCPGISQPPSMPQTFPLLPNSPLSFLPPPSYLPHHISCSLHLESLVNLLSLSFASSQTGTAQSFTTS